MIRLTTEQLEAIRKRTKKATSGNRLTDMGAFEASAIVLTEDIPALLAEVERLRELMNDLIGTVYSYGTPGESVYEKAEEVDELM